MALNSVTLTFQVDADLEPGHPEPYGYTVSEFILLYCAEQCALLKNQHLLISVSYAVRTISFPAVAPLL